MKKFIKDCKNINNIIAIAFPNGQDLTRQHAKAIFKYSHAYFKKGKFYILCALTLVLVFSQPQGNAQGCALPYVLMKTIENSCKKRNKRASFHFDN